EHVVGPAADVRADDGAVLLDAVVVGEDRPRADVRLLADLGVADIRQVGHLRARADLGVLGLDESADLAATAEHGSRPEVRERTDIRLRSDDRAGALGPYDDGALADLDVGEGGVWPDARAAFDPGRTMQLHTGLEADVRRQVDRDVDPGRQRIDDLDPLGHPVAKRAAVELGAEVGELLVSVRTLGLPYVVGRQRADPM